MRRFTSGPKPWLRDSMYMFLSEDASTRCPYRTPSYLHCTTLACIAQWGASVVCPVGSPQLQPEQLRLLCLGQSSAQPLRCTGPTERSSCNQDACCCVCARARARKGSKWCHRKSTASTHHSADVRTLFTAAAFADTPVMIRKSILNIVCVCMCCCHM